MCGIFPEIIDVDDLDFYYEEPEEEDEFEEVSEYSDQSSSSGMDSNSKGSSSGMEDSDRENMMNYGDSEDGSCSGFGSTSSDEDGGDGEYHSRKTKLDMTRKALSPLDNQNDDSDEGSNPMAVIAFDTTVTEGPPLNAGNSNIQGKGPGFI